MNFKGPSNEVKIKLTIKHLAFANSLKKNIEDHNILKQEAKDHFTKCTIQWIVIYSVDSVIHPEQLGQGRLQDSFENTPS